MGSFIQNFFRAKYLMLGTFLVTATCVLILLAIKPTKYEAHMSFLVLNERADPVVSTDSQNSMQHTEITEEDINSEAELLGSSQMLKGVVEACNLDSEYLGSSGKDRPAAIEKAMLKLSKNLAILPVRKSALINVAYRSGDRNQSVRVLNELTKQYLAKHADLHTSGKAAAFFRQQSVSIADRLHAKQEQRATELQADGYSQLTEQQDLSLQQMESTKKSLDDVTASLAETSSRLAQVKSQLATVGARLVTLDRISANPGSVESLNTKLADLRNARTTLAIEFRPGDEMLVEQDKKIADTEAALKSAKDLKSEDKTTDVNPEWLSLSAAENTLRQQMAGLNSRKAELTGQLTRQRGDIAKMGRAGIEIGELDREIKELEASLDLYRNKAISAGIAEDLDAAKIGNVVVASPPIVPVLPTTSPFNLLTGLLFAVLVSLGVGLLSTMWSERLYGNSAIESELGVPVLTSFD